MQKKKSIWKSLNRGFAQGLAVVTVSVGLIVPQTAFACTSFILPTTDGSAVYGRTMEFAVELEASMIIIPRNFQISAAAPNGKTWNAKYGAVGMNAFGITALIDGVNEKGLAGGVLYFPTVAKYTEPADAKPEDSLAPWDFLTWALTNFATVAEVKEALSTISVVSIVQENMGFVPPVHYTLHDATGASLVVEPIDGTLKVYDNPIGVMTNTPAFDWHMTNLRNYVKLSPDNVKPITINKHEIVPTGGGSGMLGVPGDATPPSRFIRASAFVLASEDLSSGVETVRQAEHVLNNFDIPKGWVRDPNTPLEYTQWSAIADLKNQVYYIKTYDDPVLRSLALADVDLDAKNLISMKMDAKLDPISLISKK